jgi:hypothetical protein
MAGEDSFLLFTLTELSTNHRATKGEEDAPPSCEAHTELPSAQNLKTDVSVTDRACESAPGVWRSMRARPTRGKKQEAHHNRVLK